MLIIMCLWVKDVDALIQESFQMICYTLIPIESRYVYVYIFIYIYKHAMYFWASQVFGG